MRMALFRKVGRIAVLVHPAGAMPDDDWGRIQREIQALGTPTPDEKMVVWADGSINANQRKAAKDMNTSGKEREVLMFTGSVVTRGVMQALAWMGMSIRSWPKSDLEKVLLQSGFSGAEVAAVKGAIADMEAQLGVSARDA